MADINVDWNAAPVPQDYTAAVQQGLGAGQAIRAQSALSGIDLDNPDSLNKGIAGLVRAGAADQASALMGLQINRSLYSQLPDFLARATTIPGQAPPAAPQAQGSALQGVPVAGAPMTPAPPSSAAGGSPVAPGQPSSGAPTSQGMSASDALEAKWTARGLPKATIDSALQQASTPEGAEALAAHSEAHATALTQGGTSGINPASLAPPGLQPPPAGATDSNAYTWAKNYLDHPEMANYEAMLKSRFGIDLGLTARAQAIMGPEFQEEAKLRNAGPITTATETAKAPFTLDDVTLPDGSKMQVPHNIALALGAGGALHGLTPQAEAEQKASGTAAGGAPYDMVTLKGPNGEEIQLTRAQMAAAATHGGLPTGPTIADAENQRSQAAALEKASTEAGARLTQYPASIARGQTLIGVANTVGTGAYTKALQDAARYLPVTHSAADYAANAGLLSQDLASTFKDALQGLPVPRVATEARSITDAIPKSTSPQDQVKIYAAANLAAQQYHQDYDRFITNWARAPDKPKDLSAANAAWAASVAGRSSLFSQPAWQGLKVGGEDAVQLSHFKGRDWLVPLHGLLGSNARAVPAPTVLGAPTPTAPPPS